MMIAKKMAPRLSLLSVLFATHVGSLSVLLSVLGKEVIPDLPSSFAGRDPDHVDPALHEIEYSVEIDSDSGNVWKSWHVYKEPNVTSFYRESDSCPASEKVKPQVRKKGNREGRVVPGRMCCLLCPHKT